MEPESRPCLREQAIEIYSNTLLQAAELGAESVRRVKRQLAQCDLFFLLTHVLGRADLNRDWYFARCREVQGTPNGHLDLWAREHGGVMKLAQKGQRRRGVAKMPRICLLFCR